MEMELQRLQIAPCDASALVGFWNELLSFFKLALGPEESVIWMHPEWLARRHEFL
jgi:hypothetical protein